MADVVQILIEVLKINCSVVQCSYANPMETLFYLLFFPSVFIILFVYMLVDFVMNRAGTTDSKILRLLLSVSFYAFIVFQDLYTFFVGLSKVWYLALILIIGIWLVIRIFFGGRRDVSGGSGFMPGFNVTSGIGDSVKRKLHSTLSGKERKLKKKIEQELKNLESQVNIIEREWKNPSPGTDMSLLIREYNSHKHYILGIIDELSNLGKVDVGSIDWDIEKLGKKYEEKIMQLDNRVKDITSRIKRKK